MMPDIKIMIAEGEENIRKILNVWFSKYGYPVEAVITGQQALNRLTRQHFDMFLIDIEMPDMDGLKLLSKIKREQPDAEVIMITAHGSVQATTKAMKLGAIDCFCKPFDWAELFLLMERVDANRALREENKVLKKQLVTQREAYMNRFVAESEAMQKVVASIKEVSKTSYPILINGARGVGKDMVAQAIHYHSRKAAGPFVTVDCGALSESLLQKELFGYAAKDSAGEVKPIKGQLEMANNGTIFLNEIDELSFKMQVALLQVLKQMKNQKEYERKTFSSDFRLISATGRNLSQLSRSRHFRQDFYDRISHFSIHIPSLRKRKEDIPLLADSFLTHFKHETGKRLDGFAIDALNSLNHYDWPGNVRELRNVIQRAAVLAKGRMIDSKEINFLHQQKQEYGPGGLTLKEVEVSHIKASLKAFNWNVSQTARQLGIDRSTLNRKIKTYQIQKRR